MAAAMEGHLTYTLPCNTEALHNVRSWRNDLPVVQGKAEAQPQAHGLALLLRMPAAPRTEHAGAEWGTVRLTAVSTL